MSKVLAVIVCCIGASAVWRTASAAEYCVSCTGPDASYRCAIDGTPDGPGTDPRAQLLCITKLAQTGGHESCSVRRLADYPCPGELRVISAPLEAPPGAAGSPPGQDAGAAPPPGEDAGAAPASDAPSGEGEPPQTVEELAGQTVKSSQEGLKKAGDALTGGAKATGEAVAGTAEKAGSAIGTAAKKSWRCIASLFTDCGGSDAAPETEAPPQEQSPPGTMVEPAEPPAGQ